jgi:hypothetical protein
MKTIANQERSMQKRQVKVLYLTPGTDFSFVADPVFGAAAVSFDQEVSVSRATIKQ